MKRDRSRRYLTLRMRLAFWIAGLLLLFSVGLVLFINSIAVVTTSTSTTTIVGDLSPITLAPPDQATITASENTFPTTSTRIEQVTLGRVQAISMVGLVIIALFGSISAYLITGVALKPLRKVNQCIQQITPETLKTRLKLESPEDELKALADAFDELLDRLEQAFEQQGRFVADAAHELRTPLTNLRSNLEVVVCDQRATIEDYKKMTLAFERSLTRLEHLVEDLLTLASQQKKVGAEKIELAVMLEEVVSELLPKAQTQQVTLSLEILAEVQVQADSALLSRLFSNLIENGINYNMPGGKVTVTTYSQNNWAITKVTDTGIGILPQDQSRIFERFYRVEKSRSRNKGGAGLGLSVVDYIVKLYGGRLLLESQSGVGSTFTIYLPGSTSFTFTTSKESPA